MEPARRELDCDLHMVLCADDCDDSTGSQEIQTQTQHSQIRSSIHICLERSTMSSGNSFALHKICLHSLFDLNFTKCGQAAIAHDEEQFVSQQE